MKISTTSVFSAVFVLVLSASAEYLKFKDDNIGFGAGILVKQKSLRHYVIINHEYKLSQLSDTAYAQSDAVSNIRRNWDKIDHQSELNNCVGGIGGGSRIGMCECDFSFCSPINNPEFTDKYLEFLVDCKRRDTCVPEPT